MKPLASLRRVCSVALVLGLTAYGDQTSAAAPTFAIGPTTATPSPVAPGQTEAIQATVTAGAAASTVNVDVEIWGGTKVAQKIFTGQSLAAGEARAFSWSYPVPSTLPAGTYAVKVGVFSGDWTTLYTWNNRAAAFDVTVGAPPPPPPAGACTGGFTIGPATATPNPVAPGGTETIQTPVCSGSAAASVLVDLELFDGGGSRIGQKVFSGQAFAAGETKTYSWAWPVPAGQPAGLYTVKVGVFSGDWSTLFKWSNQAVTFSVGTGAPSPPPPPGTCTGGVTIGPTTAAPTPVAPGGTETIQTQVCSGSAGTSLNVDLEIFSAAGQRIAQKIFTGQSVAAGVPTAFTWDFLVPPTLPTGTYTVKVGVFSGDWATLHKWDNQAASLTVSATGSPTSAIGLEAVVTGISLPVAITHAGDDRLFITLKTGQVRIHSGGQLLPAPFLDLSGQVATAGEGGMLSLAFDPDYARNGRFYVYYTVPDADPVTNPGGHIVVARYTVSAGDPNTADPTSQLVLLTVPHLRLTNHYGGQLQFGPDGYLYIATGDGGTGQGANSQNLGSLLGKLLRIDVHPVPPADGSAPPPYVVPASNPFVSTAGARPEIWALGLRNPWRFSFDRGTGDLFIADVGEARWEEVDFQPAGSPGGANFGWSLMEGRECFPPGTVGCSAQGTLTAPVLTYGHGSGECSITGGYAYRGQKLALPPGTYLFGDFCSGRIWAASVKDGVWSRSELVDTTLKIDTFGEGADGELYVAHYTSSGPGAIYRIVGTR